MRSSFSDLKLSKWIVRQCEMFGDEGGYEPKIGSVEEALNSIIQAVEPAGCSMQTHFALDLDEGLSALNEDGIYKSKNRKLTSEELAQYYCDFAEKCLIISLEGLNEPTPIQANCIPRILKGEDCIGCAKTGSGKTLAFALPILEKLSQEPYGIFALILTPTRELAFQIGDQFSAYGRTINLKLSIIVGGMDMVTQGQSLSKKPHIVVSTPGRLADHIESCNTFSLAKIKFLVLDEADRLLGGHFDEQIKTIFSVLPSQRQTLFFSATLTDTLEQVRDVASSKVFLYVEPSDTATVDQLQQFYVLCPDHVKDAYLVELIRIFRERNEDGNMIIFTDTCKNCQLLSMMLNEVGFENVALHAMIKQKERLAALARFKSNVVKTLIATDVASRGLDIPTVELVINHSIPNVPKDYVHRVGRTARAGRAGTSVSLVTPSDVRLIHAIEEMINTKLKEYSVNDKEVIKILTQVKVTKREAEMKLEENDFYEKKLINKRKKMILEGKDPDEEEEMVRNKKLKVKKKRKMNLTNKNIFYPIEKHTEEPITNKS